jgi:Rrf2 family protein
MKMLSAAGGYAVRALAFLARRPSNGLVSAEAIAAAEGLPPLFLPKVLKPLVSAGVLDSLKGPKGGYRLARAARQVTLLDVVEAVDGPVRGDVPVWAPEAGRKLDGRLRAACDAVTETERGQLRRVSIADLVGEG